MRKLKCPWCGSEKYNGLTDRSLPNSRQGSYCCNTCNKLFTLRIEHKWMVFSVFVWPLPAIILKLLNVLPVCQIIVAILSLFLWWVVANKDFHICRQDENFKVLPNDYNAKIVLRSLSGKSIKHGFKRLYIYEAMFDTMENEAEEKKYAFVIGKINSRWTESVCSAGFPQKELMPAELFKIGVTFEVFDGDKHLAHGEILFVSNNL